MNLDIIAQLAPHHANSCALHDPTPGPCDCGAKAVPLVRYADVQPLTDENYRLQKTIEAFLSRWEDTDRAISCLKNASMMEISDRVKVLEEYRLTMRVLTANFK